MVLWSLGFWAQGPGPLVVSDIWGSSVFRWGGGCVVLWMKPLSKLPEAEQVWGNLAFLPLGSEFRGLGLTS